MWSSYAMCLKIYVKKAGLMTLAPSHDAILLEDFISGLAPSNSICVLKSTASVKDNL